MALGDSMFQSGPSFRERRAEQEYLEFLQSTVRGEPGMPVANPEPFKPVEMSELVDGPVEAPAPERPKRKRKAPRKADMPARDREAVNLAKYVASSGVEVGLVFLSAGR